MNRAGALSQLPSPGSVQAARLAFAVPVIDGGARLASDGSPKLPWQHHAIPLRVRGLAMIKTHEREKLINAIVFFAANTGHCGKIKLIRLSSVAPGVT